MRFSCDGHVTEAARGTARGLTSDTQLREIQALLNHVHSAAHMTVMCLQGHSAPGFERGEAA